MRKIGNILEKKEKRSELGIEKGEREGILRGIIAELMPEISSADYQVEEKSKEKALYIKSRHSIIAYRIWLKKRMLERTLTEISGEKQKIITA